jgi:hypothetical protein
MGGVHPPTLLLDADELAPAEQPMLARQPFVRLELVGLARLVRRDVSLFGLGGHAGSSPTSYFL